MHKLAKGLKKKKKQKKGKKGADDDEFDPEELERYRRERAEALEKAAEAEATGEQSTGAAGSDEWQKFQALTAGVDSILKKTQGDLDRIKSTSFFQKKAPVVEEPKPKEDPEVTRNKEKRYLGFDKDGNPIEQVKVSTDEVDKKSGKLTVSEEGFVDVPEDEDEQEDSAEEDIFDTTYVDVLQNIDVQLAYIPDSPTEEEFGDDPFDTTNADKVLKTVDKRGKKVVSLGNAVEVLSGRIDHVSTCKLSRPRKVQIHDLLLDETDSTDPVEAPTEPFEVERTLLDDDSDLPDIPVDLTQLPSVLPRPVTPSDFKSETDKLYEAPLDISEFEILKERTALEEIPDLDEDFDLDGPIDVHLDEADDPFAEKESDEVAPDLEIIDASFVAATFVNEEDPFDTTFAENILPGKTELKFIEKELEALPSVDAPIVIKNPPGLRRNFKAGNIEACEVKNNLLASKKDLLGGSRSDLSQLVDQPIAPVEEIKYVDPFDTSGIEEPAPGKTELKFLEKELLGGEKKEVFDNLDDDDFDPRKEDSPIPEKSNFKITFEAEEQEAVAKSQARKPSRPEALGLAPGKSVAFELPTPSRRPDLLITSDEEKSISSKPLTPYYSQKSLEETLPEEEETARVDVDPFDTSFVSKAAPGKTELKLIESELLKQEPKLSHSLSNHEINPRIDNSHQVGRRQSDFGTTSFVPKSLKPSEVEETLIEDSEGESKTAAQVNEAVHRKKAPPPKRQESILDADVASDAKSLTPRIDSKLIEEDEEISYVDPFDTSIACNILPGKAELKLLESELSQIPHQVQQIRIPKIDLEKVSAPPIPILDDGDDFDPRAGEVKEAQDFLSSEDQDLSAKVLTPLNDKAFLDDNIDPFDTSFAAIGPGKTELKLLESELMEK